jgi:hypothetical protein
MWVVSKPDVDNLWITLLLTGAFLRLPDAFVVGLAEREPGEFLSTSVYTFQPLSVG